MTAPLTSQAIRASPALIVNAIMFCDYEGHGFATDYAMSVESAKFYRVYYMSCSYMIFAIFGVAAPCFFDVKMCSRVCVGWGVSLSCVGLGPVVQTDASVPQQDTNSAG